jgi:hypothetical protein
MKNAYIVLVVSLVLGLVAPASAGIPDADASHVTMTAQGKGLSTCPAGDGDDYSYITVTALRSDLTPIQGIPSNSFFFTITGSGSGNVSINAYDSETDASGVIRFQAHGDGVVAYGSLTIQVQIYTVVLNDSDLLWCNTFDYDGNGTVNPVDFVAFASYYGSSSEMGDFDWDGTVNPVDFVEFASHYGHSAP